MLKNNINKVPLWENIEEKKNRNREKLIHELIEKIDVLKKRKHDLNKLK